MTAPARLAALAALLLLGSACATTRTEPPPGDDAVDIGYGTQDREAVTGSVESVDVDAARRHRPAARLADLLQGNVAGVYVREAPGGGITVRIRGASSIRGSNAPLYVVDGIAVEPDRGGTLTFLNAQDVASITILKDAAATAIYGTRGAHGVIVIQTKH